MFFFVLYNRKIAKCELDNTSNHALFVDLKKKMDIRGSNDRCIKQLLDFFLKETMDRRSYRICMTSCQGVHFSLLWNIIRLSYLKNATQYWFLILHSRKVAFWTIKDFCPYSMISATLTLVFQHEYSRVRQIVISTHRFEKYPTTDGIKI